MDPGQWRKVNHQGIAVELRLSCFESKDREVHFLEGKPAEMRVPVQVRRKPEQDRQQPNLGFKVEDLERRETGLVLA